MKKIIRYTFLVYFCICTHVLNTEEQKDNFSFTEKFLIGAATGGITIAAVEPLLYLKNRWQQNKKPSINPKIFYRGLFVNAAGFVPTMAIQNSIFGQTEELLDQTNIHPLYKKLIAATAAGTASALPCSPRELLIIQQQNHGGNFYTVAKNIIKTHGIQKMLRGFVPVAIRNSSFAGFFFVATPYFQEKIKEQVDNPAIQKLGPSILAGALSAKLTHPLDTIKTDMQANINNDGVIMTANTMYKKANSSAHALKIFYAGMIPRIIGVAIGMTLEYNLREKLMEWLAKDK